MALNSRTCSILVLRWVVGLVVLVESFRAVRGALANLHGPHMKGIRPEILLALAVPEIVAAILFLVPKTRKLGGYALLVIFALGATVHVLHGQWSFELLLVYAAAVWAVLANG